MLSSKQIHHDTAFEPAICRNLPDPHLLSHLPSSLSRLSCNSFIDESAVVVRTLVASNVTAFDLSTKEIVSSDLNIDAQRYYDTLIVGLITTNAAVAAGIATCVATVVAA